MQRYLPSTFNLADLDEKQWFGRAPYGKETPGFYQFIDEPERAGWEKNKGSHPEINWSADAVTYHINTQRHRGSILPARGQSAAFGCSFTFGYGVDESEHWPGLLGVANCGESGSSNDQIVRTAISYINYWQPADVFVMFTFPNRREWINDAGEYRKFKGLTPEDRKRILKETDFGWETAHLALHNEYSDHYNFYKNKVFLESFCQAKNVRLHFTTVGEIDYLPFTPARDLNHPGPLWHLLIAEHFKT